jgi:hypothetical protein
MTDIDVMQANVAAVAADDELAAPAKTLWQRSEAAVLGTGGILALLVAW